MGSVLHIWFCDKKKEVALVFVLTHTHIYKNLLPRECHYLNHWLAHLSGRVLDPSGHASIVRETMN